MKDSKLRKYAQTIQLTKLVFSPCGTYVAFGVDLHNNEETCFMIRNIEKGHTVGVKGWEDNRLNSVDNMVFHRLQNGPGLGLFYTKLNNNKRPYELWHQNMQTGEKKLLYSEKD